MFKVILSVCTVCIGLLMMASYPLAARRDTATLEGRVVDATGATVPSVSITVVNTTTNFSYHAQSDVSGGGSSAGAYRYVSDPHIRARFQADHCRSYHVGCAATSTGRHDAPTRRDQRARQGNRRCAFVGDGFLRDRPSHRQRVHGGLSAQWAQCCGACPAYRRRDHERAWNPRLGRLRFQCQRLAFF